MSLINKPIVSCVNVGKSYEDFTVLSKVNFSIQKGEKWGLVGANGSGKSTLLKIISGQIKNDTGIVTILKSVRVAYVPQDFTEYKDISVSEFIISLALNKNEISQHKIFSVLNNLCLDSSILKRKIGDLSGGEKTKLGLVRILLSDYDFYVLDEPTNNLDIHALTILERFVKDSLKTFLIVSHDREFLDKIAQKIIEISEHSRNAKIYDGNFSAYILKKNRDIERQWIAYSDKIEKQEKLEKNTEAKLKWMNDIDKKRLNIKNLPIHEKEKGVAAELRDSAGRMGHRVKVAKDKAERFKNNTKTIEKPKEQLPLKVDFQVEKRSGDKVFDLNGVTKTTPNFVLGPIDISVLYGDRILILGENGSGKSTLLKIMLRLLKQDSGDVKIGNTVSVGYIPQQEDFLPNTTVLEEFLRHTKMDEGIGRRSLNRFRITTNDVKKKISELSSGERSRLILAIIMANRHNCLVLDEPSNHLDLEVLEEFEDAIRRFEGTIIVVSHDRYFIKKIKLQKTYLLEGGKLTNIGEFDKYEEKFLDK